MSASCERSFFAVFAVDSIVPPDDYQMKFAATDEVCRAGYRRPYQMKFAFSASPLSIRRFSPVMDLLTHARK